MTCVWFQRLKLYYDELLSRFAFKFNLRHYTEALHSNAAHNVADDILGRGFHWSIFQLNLSRFGHLLVSVPLFNRLG